MDVPLGSDDGIPVSSFTTSPIVTISVGQSTFLVHKELLVARCPFFAKCLEAGTQESVTNEVKLPDDSPDTIYYFITYIYTDQVYVVDGNEDGTVVAIVKAWALAEKFGMPDWQNRLSDHLMAYWREEFVTPANVSCALDSLRKTSPLWKLVFDQFAYDIGYDDDYDDSEAADEEDADEYSKEFGALCSKSGFSAARLVRNIIGQLRGKRTIMPVNQGCKYHVHAEGQSCSEK